MGCVPFLQLLFHSGGDDDYVVLRDSKHALGDISKLVGVLADKLENRSSGELLLDISRHYLAHAFVQFLA
jgi:hypothetical protein